MELILSHLIFDPTGVIALSVLSLAFLIQLFYYLFYYRKPVSYFNNTTTEAIEESKLPSVSIVIIAKNESENLAKNLPLILNQDYPNFEVIVVNDGSTDESEHILKRMKLEQAHLYHTFSPESDDLSPTRQRILSLTIGIKAAHNEVLLFTEADSFPLSNKWIRAMMNEMGNYDIILGYSRSSTNNGFWSRVAKFDNLLFSLQYMSKAIKGKAYIGVYKNIAYKKNLFFANKGFSASLNYDNAEQIFLNSLIVDNKTTVALSENSFIDTQMESFSLWESIKANYYRARKRFIGFRHKSFSLEIFSRMLFHITTIAGISYCIYTQLWAYLIAILLIYTIRTSIQGFILNKAAKLFMTAPLHFTLPILDILQPIYNKYFQLSAKSYKRR